MPDSTWAALLGYAALFVATLAYVALRRATPPEKLAKNPFERRIIREDREDSSLFDEFKVATLLFLSLATPLYLVFLVYLGISWVLWVHASPALALVWILAPVYTPLLAGLASGGITWGDLFAGWWFFK